MKTFASVGLILLAACGGGTAAPDAVVPDARTPDAVPLDGQHAGELGFHVVDSIGVPTDSTQSENDGFDLDGDGTIDNQLGNIDSALVQAGGSGNFDPQAMVTRQVDDGDILLLVAGVTCGGLCLKAFTGTNPAPAPCDGAGDTTCRHHLDGTGTFDAAFDPANDQVDGARVADTYEATGALRFPISIFAGPPAWVHLERAHVLLTANGAEWSGKIGGAVPDGEIQGELVPAIHEGVASAIDADCTGTSPPECGCAPNSNGATMIGLFDDNQDCTVTLAEVQNNSLIQTLLRPDVDTDGDGTTDALSMGELVTTVAAQFDLP